MKTDEGFERYYTIILALVTSRIKIEEKKRKLG